jgi:hypothetical protein
MGPSWGSVGWDCPIFAGNKSHLDVERFDRGFSIRWLGEKEVLPILDTRAGLNPPIFAFTWRFEWSSRGGREC